MSLAALLAVAAFAILYYLDSRSRRGIHPELVAVEGRDPVADLRARLAVGDHRLLALHGVGDVVPGVPEEDRDLQRRFGLRFIPGTSDCIVSDEHLRLQLVAHEYAERYNAGLLGAIRERNLQPNPDFLGEP